jgi:hypothetical protein
MEVFPKNNKPLRISLLMKLDSIYGLKVPGMHRLINRASVCITKNEISQMEGTKEEMLPLRPLEKSNLILAL